MPSAAWALQQSIFAVLTADTVLTTLLGANRIFDDVPQATPLPYVTLGQAAGREWSTSTEDGTEHILTLHAWSRARGKQQVHAIIDALRAALHDQPLTLAGHHLVNLRHESSETRRDPDGETIHGIVRFRAVTEAA